MKAFTLSKAPQVLARSSRLSKPLHHSPAKRSFLRAASTMTTGEFKYIDPESYTRSSKPFVKPWSKVDGPGTSFTLTSHKHSVEDIRGHESNFSTDTSGFSVHRVPASEKSFTDDAAVRNGYYSEVEAILRSKLPGVKKVVIFDHTIRRREKASPRQPVQQVHVDQTPNAAMTRVRRHLPLAEAEELLKCRYQIINVWRPIANPASDFPLAVIDWRSTSPSDFVNVDLLYPKSNSNTNDDRGKEVLPDTHSTDSITGYEIKGETYGIVPNDSHKFYYMSNMSPNETIFIKCFDSWSQSVGGKEGLAGMAPHTAFVDPATPADAPGRQSIEVRCLVFYD